MELLDRYRGALLGLAAGDALGTTLEFRRPGGFEPLTDIVGGGPFHLKPGEWTDDTSMALCLAESLVERPEFDPRHQMETYCRWHNDGHLSVKGWCFDIGGTTSAALGRFERSGEPYSGSTDEHAAGNGSIMRLAPVPLRYAFNPREAIARAADSSRTTHGAVECVDACRYLAGLIVGAIHGLSKAELLAPNYSPVPGLWDEAPLAPNIAEIAAGSFLRREPPEIRGSGYVVASLEAALWAFSRGTDFRDGALRAVNLGDDADTTGAVYGQLAGAFYGESGIPEEWRAKLAMRELIEEQAAQLLKLASPLAA
ncbi:MAG: ADP-ribosylglycohydrolase family protein [Gemmataceae bacterium]